MLNDLFPAIQWLITHLQLSCLKLLFQSEAWCTAFHLNIGLFIFISNELLYTRPHLEKGAQS